MSESARQLPRANRINNPISRENMSEIIKHHHHKDVVARDFVGLKPEVRSLTTIRSSPRRLRSSTFPRFYRVFVPTGCWHVSCDTRSCQGKLADCELISKQRKNSE